MLVFAAVGWICTRLGMAVKNKFGGGKEEKVLESKGFESTEDLEKGGVVDRM